MHPIDHAKSFLTTGLPSLGMDFTERSTWVGLFKILGAFGLITLTPDVQEHIILVFIGLAGLINLFVRDSGKKE